MKKLEVSNAAPDSFYTSYILKQHGLEHVLFLRTVNTSRK